MVWDSAKQDSALFQYLSSLVALRRSHPVWSRGEFQMLSVDDARRVYAFERAGMGVRGIVVINDGNESSSVRIASGVKDGVTCSEVWPASGLPCQVPGGFLEITVPARSGKIYLEVKK